jgi:hypothetical protein
VIKSFRQDLKELKGLFNTILLSVKHFQKISNSNTRYLKETGKIKNELVKIYNSKIVDPNLSFRVQEFNGAAMLINQGLVYDAVERLIAALV